MDILFKSIEYTIEKSIKQYSDAISKKYEIDSKELEKMWKDISSNIEFINKTNGQKTPIKKTETKKTETKKTEESQGGCTYLFVRGKNSGSKCGAKIKSGDYCSKHEKFENSTPKSKKSLPKAKPVTTPKSTSPAPKKINKVIRENKSINKFWHPETQLVFKSKEERVVIGRLKDDKICDLDEEDIKLCESYGFKMEDKAPTKSEATKKTIAKDAKDADIEDVLNKIMEDEDCDEDCDEEDELDEDYELEDE